MSDDKKIGFGSCLALVIGAISVAGLGTTAVMHCSNEKTERRRIEYKETKLYLKMQHKMELLKAKFDR
jgi:hypothetical protein